MTIPNDLSNITKVYYGVDPTTDAGQELWQEFVATLPPNEPIEEGDPDLQKQYLAFLSNKLSTTYLSEAANALSPSEIESRRIIYTIFDIILTLMGRISTTQINNSMALNFIARRRGEYGEMEKRAFTYIGTGTIYRDPPDERNIEMDDNPESSVDARETVTRPSSVASEFELGYANITVDDITKWLYAKMMTTNKSEETFDLYSPGWETSHVEWNAYDPPPQNMPEYDEGRNHVIFKVTKNDDGSVSYSCAFNLEGYDGEDWVLVDKVAKETGTTPASDLTLPDPQNGLNSAFMSVYAAAKEAKLVEITPEDLPKEEYKHMSDLERNLFCKERDLKIQWQVGSLASKLEPDSTGEWGAKISALTKQRAQLNQRLSSFYDTVSSRLDMEDSAMQQQQQVLDSSASGKQSTSQLLTNIIQQLNQIISSIFRH